MPNTQVGKIYKPATVDFGEVPISSTVGGVSLGLNIATVNDNQADQVVGEGLSRITANAVKVTFKTVDHSPEVMALFTGGTVDRTNANKPKLILKATGILAKGDLIILTQTDLGYPVTVTLPDAQNIPGGDLNVGAKSGGYGAELPLAFGGYWASDAAGYGHIEYDLTPLAVQP